MSEDTTLYRLNAIDSRLTGIDEKFDTIVTKIDSLKEDLIKSKCSQPNMCLILKSQIDNTTATLVKINERLDAGEKRCADTEKKVVSLENWQRIAFYTFGFLGSLAVFFRDQIVHVLNWIF